MKELLLFSLSLVLLNSCNNKGGIEKGECTDDPRRYVSIEIK
jgi:hypothetical protein